MINDETITKKIKYFLDNYLPVHIVKKDGKWLNGYILISESADFFILNEFKLGEVPVFVGEINTLDAYIYPKDKEVKDGKHT